ncbi:hypothetical protein J6590_039836 [Homalodisca vitripennis]|nr:hypothetical protein J6590_039836 [Homalodisca vitripennis]
MYYIDVIRKCLCRNLVRCEHIQHGDQHPVRMTGRLGTDMTSPVLANEASGIPWTTLYAILTPFGETSLQHRSVLFGYSKVTSQIELHLLVVPCLPVSCSPQTLP